MTILTNLAAAPVTLAALTSTAKVWIVGSAVVGSALLGIAALAIYTRKKELRANEAARAEYHRWCASIAANGDALPPCEAPIRLERDETCYFAADAVTLLEPRAVHRGAQNGISTRAMSGVYIHSSGVTFDTRDEWKPITTGSLYVTSKRIIFDGDVANRIIELADILSIQQGYRTACVNSRTSKRPVAFAKTNGQIFAAVVNTLCDAL